MTTRNKTKLAALNKKNCDEHPRSNLAHSTELIHTRTEPLRKKQVSTEQLIPKGAISILIYLFF